MWDVLVGAPAIDMSRGGNDALVGMPADSEVAEGAISRREGLTSAAASPALDLSIVLESASESTTRDEFDPGGLGHGRWKRGVGDPSRAPTSGEPLVIQGTGVTSTSDNGLEGLSCRKIGTLRIAPALDGAILMQGTGVLGATSNLDESVSWGWVGFA